MVRKIYHAAPTFSDMSTSYPLRGPKNKYSLCEQYIMYCRQRLHTLHLLYAMDLHTSISAVTSRL
jgi:hypothetical protein